MDKIETHAEAQARQSATLYGKESLTDAVRALVTRLRVDPEVVRARKAVTGRDAFTHDTADEQVEETTKRFERRYGKDAAQAAMGALEVMESDERMRIFIEAGVLGNEPDTALWLAHVAQATEKGGQ